MLNSELLRGNTDMIILSELAAKNSYGYELNKSIGEKSGGEFSLNEATLYTAFKRLEGSGAVVSFWGDETTGARRKYYKLTELGLTQLDALKADWRAAVSLINVFIGENQNG